MISASTDNIDVMHRVLQDAAARENVAESMLTPEQWLEDFYRRRKGSGKPASNDRDKAA